MRERGSLATLLVATLALATSNCNVNVDPGGPIDCGPDGSACFSCSAPSPCGLFVYSNGTSYYAKGCEASVDAGEE